MIQEPKNYHLITDSNLIVKLFDFGRDFCVFDTETTGRSAEHEKIIEIGFVRHAHKSAKIDFARNHEYKSHKRQNGGKRANRKRRNSKIR